MSDVFYAVAEPQRREILVLLWAGERSVTELAPEQRMTQQGRQNTGRCFGRSDWCETARAHDHHYWMAPESRHLRTYLSWSQFGES